MTRANEPATCADCGVSLGASRYWRGIRGPLCAACGPGIEFPPPRTAMTIRETMAMYAMQGLLANPEDPESLPPFTQTCETLYAQRAVMFADALLAQLALEPTKKEMP